METKICTKCGIEKSIEEFSWHNKSKGIRQSACKKCVNQYNKEYKQKTRQNIHDIKKDLCCAKCGYNQNIWALDFHHRDPALKDEGIARLISNRYSTKRIMSEIEKCVILCANCHRVFHFLEKEQGLTIEEFLDNGVSPSWSKAQDFDSCIVGSNPTAPACNHLRSE